MLFKVSICSLMLWLLMPVVACRAIEPGYYPPKSDGRFFDVNAPTDSDREIRDAVFNPASILLFIDDADKIRVSSLTVPNPISFSATWHTRDEVAGCLKDVKDKSFLRVWISTSNMWGPPEKSEALVRELQPFIDKLGYERVLIFAFKPHNDGHTFMHPSNGCVKCGVLVFQDKRVHTSPAVGIRRD